ncbi:MAG: protoheme IX farnesyltransferase [Alphaproteobacteria bacterium]|nr:protoheme IX farnesyltransferase [Alphaproteobacteria bacterium]
MALSDSAADSRTLSTDVLGASGVGDFFALLKPKVMSLVVFTGLVGLLLAPGAIHPVLGAIAVLCIAVAAGAAGAVNMWYDRDIDAIMQRTQSRPIPSGRVEPAEALGLGIVLSIASVVVMALAVNFVAAALLALSILFYVFVYTAWLKRRTPQNIVIGGAAGAFPPMIGWAAATGDVSIGSVVLFLIIFMWTPPHFWALALFSSGEYAKAGVPMLPVVAGDRETRRQILFYSILLVPVSLLPTAFGVAGMGYAVAAAGLGLLFVAGAVHVWRDRSAASARRLFGYSVLYLFLLFALMVIDRVTPGAA